jgi:lipoate-protein ligase A
MIRVAEIRFIVDPPTPGAQNMAVDEALLLDAVESGIATLRFYAWSEPTLSLGYFQRFEDRYSHPTSRQCTIVRRQTGGGAILHDRELTYSVTLPARHALARESESLYAAVHEAFIAELNPLVATANLPWHLVRHDHKSTLPASKEPFLCFQRRARGDVLLVPSASADNPHLATTQNSSSTAKILGSAQRRFRGAILQHGSLLLEKSPQSPELPGWRDITDIDILSEHLIDGLTVRLANVFGALNLLPPTSSRELQSKAEQIANRKYRSGAWTKRR